MSTNNIMKTVMDHMNDDTVAPYARVIGLLGALTNVPQVYCTEVLGNAGATREVACPGTPKFVIVANENSGTFAIKYDGFATSSAVKVNSAGPAVSVAANLITIATDKITIGNDAQLNTNHQLHVFAIIGKE